MLRLAATVFLTGLSSILPISAQQTSGSIDVPAGARVVLQAQGEGVQIYSCKATAGAVAWTLTGPDAQLRNAAGQVIGKHFAGPTWQLTDGSTVQGALIASQPSPEAGSVAWLLLRAKPGTATGRMSDVAFIRRTETQGGAAKPSACRSADDIGNAQRVHYSATYTFYAAK